MVEFGWLHPLFILKGLHFMHRLLFESVAFLHEFTMVARDWTRALVVFILADGPFG